MTARITIRDTHDRVRGGHPWIFDNQVVRMDGNAAPGDVVKVFDAARMPLGQGTINPASRIRVRMLTTSLDEPIDDAFFHRRIADAWAHRQRMRQPASCRVVFGEADGLPGLVVDKFTDILVVQVLTLGMERRIEAILRALRAVIAPRGIYLRNDVAVRAKEGLPLHKDFAGEPFDTRLEVEENGLFFGVDVAEGQKTGHFLDQRLNHASMATVSDGARVLDLFTHTGGFALHAARYGAREVLGLDISEAAVAQATANADRNGLAGSCEFRTANVFDFLSEASRQGSRWDTIVIDPPAFAKSRAALDNAWRGYKEVNLRAMKCLPPGGFLVTCSCSQHLTPDLFRRMVAEAARDAHRQLREIHYDTQPPDHPVHWSIPETLYLKCLVLQVL